jgi:hypothetical protein
MQRKTGQNPYWIIKDDWVRLYALISRDVRLVLIASICALGHIWTWREFFVWLKSHH